MANWAVEAALSSARLLLIGSYESKLELGFGRATGTYDSATLADARTRTFAAYWHERLSSAGAASADGRALANATPR